MKKILILLFSLVSFAFSWTGEYFDSDHWKLTSSSPNVCYERSTFLSSGYNKGSTVGDDLDYFNFNNKLWIKKTHITRAEYISATGITPEAFYKSFSIEEIFSSSVVSLSSCELCQGEPIENNPSDGFVEVGIVSADSVTSFVSGFEEAHPNAITELKVSDTCGNNNYVNAKEECSQGQILGEDGTTWGEQGFSHYSCIADPDYVQCELNEENINNECYEKCSSINAYRRADMICQECGDYSTLEGITDCLCQGVGESFSGSLNITEIVNIGDTQYLTDQVYCDGGGVRVYPYLSTINPDIDYNSDPCMVATRPSYSSSYILKKYVASDLECAAFVDGVNYLNYNTQEIFPNCPSKSELYCFLMPSLDNEDEGVEPPISDINNTLPDGSILNPDLSNLDNNSSPDFSNLTNSVSKSNELLNQLTLDLKSSNDYLKKINGAQIVNSKAIRDDMEASSQAIRDQMEADSQAIRDQMKADSQAIHDDMNASTEAIRKAMSDNTEAVRKAGNDNNSSWAEIHRAIGAKTGESTIISKLDEVIDTLKGDSNSSGSGNDGNDSNGDNDSGGSDLSGDTLGNIDSITGLLSDINTSLPTFEDDNTTTMQEITDFSLSAYDDFETKAIDSLTDLVGSIDYGIFDMFAVSNYDFVDYPISLTLPMTTTKLEGNLMSADFLNSLDFSLGRLALLLATLVFGVYYVINRLFS